MTLMDTLIFSMRTTSSRGRTSRCLGRRPDYMKKQDGLQEKTALSKTMPPQRWGGFFMANFQPVNLDKEKIARITKN